METWSSCKMAGLVVIWRVSRTLYEVLCRGIDYNTGEKPCESTENTWIPPQCPNKLFFQEPCTLAVNVSTVVISLWKGVLNRWTGSMSSSTYFIGIELVFNCQTDYRKTKGGSRITVKFIRWTVSSVFKWSHLDQSTIDGKQEKKKKNMYEKNSLISTYLPLKIQN